MSRSIRTFYETNPLLISSPFGGVDGIHKDLFLDVLHRLQIDLRGRTVLDVGCGRGYSREIVANQGGKYVGVDLVASGAGFPLALADASGLPFPPAAFDAVFCIDVFEHIPDSVAATREFRRVLRPGGFVFLSSPNYSNVAGLVKWLYESLGWYEKNTWAPFRRWQPQELEQALMGRAVRRAFRAAGFSEFTRIGHGAEVGLGLFPWIDHPRMIESVQFRLQRLFARVGPALVRAWPAASLHSFWKIEG